jgi:arylsulfatase A-like enzyme
VNRRDFIASSLAACASVATLNGCKTGPGQKVARRPNVVLIVADDLGYGELSSYGGRDVQTPHIDSIGQNGVRFTNGYVTCPVCSPTRAALLTGRYQQRFGHEFNPGPPTEASPDFGLALSEPTLAERFKKLGYSTGMVGKWHLGYQPQFTPTQRGFDEFYGFLGGAHFYLSAGDRNRGPILRGTTPVDAIEYTTFDFAREASAYIERHKNEPFFLYLPFNAVHGPLEATPAYLAKFSGIQNEKRQKFCAMLASLDDAVGMVLSKLRETGLEDDTVLYFIGDNGGPTPSTTSANGPLRDYKTTVFEGGIRVPFAMQWPGHVPKGITYHKPVVSLDIMPTSLVAAGVHIDRQWKLDGVDLLPHLTGKRSNAPHDFLYWRTGKQKAIRHGDMKLLMQRNSTTWELYDLAKDVAESNNLAEEQPDIVKTLAARWSGWNAELMDPRWPGAAENRARAR